MPRAARVSMLVLVAACHGGGEGRAREQSVEALIGLEQPVAAPVLSPSHGANAPAIASLGSQALVVWDDSRVDLARPVSFAARIDASGVPLDPTGLRLRDPVFDFSYPTVAAATDRYLVVWPAGADAGAALMACRVDATGAVLDPGGFAVVARSGAVGFRAYAAASDGRDFVVAWVERPTPAFNAGDVFVARVASDGTVRDPLGIRVTDGGIADLVGLASSDAGYWLTWEGYAGVRAARLSPGLVDLDPSPIALSGVGASQVPQAVFDGRNWITVWSESRGQNAAQLVAARVDAQGTVLDPDGGVALTDAGLPVAPHVAFDGELLVAWTEYTRELIWVQRFSPALSPLAPPAQLADAGPQGVPAVAALGGHFAVAWSTQSAAVQNLVFVGSVSPGGAVDAGRLLSAAGDRQTFPSAAYAAGVGRYLVAWNDDLAAGRLAGVATVDLAGEVLGAATLAETLPGPQGTGPTVACAQSVCGLGWRQTPGASWLWLDPVSLARADAGRLELTDAGVYGVAAAAWGSHFFITWSEGDLSGRLRFMVLDASGAVVAQPTALDPQAGDQQAAAVCADSTGFLVAYANDDFSFTFPVWAARFSPAGLPQGTAQVSSRSLGALACASAASGAAIVAWADPMGTRSNVAAAVSDGGLSFGPPLAVVQDVVVEAYEASPVTAAWDGRSFVVGYRTRASGTSRAKVVHVSTAGAVLDPQGVDLTPVASDEQTPVLSFGPPDAGGIAAYSRYDASPQAHNSGSSCAGSISTPTEAS